MQHALEPASSIIRRFGGADRVQQITGASRTRVYRWTQPKGAGGTDGFIPIEHARKLLKVALAENIPVTADDFFGVSSGEVPA